MPARADDPARTPPRLTGRAAPFPDAPVLDIRMVQQCVDLGGPEDPGFFVSLVGDFRAAAGATLDAVDAGLSARDWNAVRRGLHTLRSAGATIGAARLAAVCRRMEAADDATLASTGAAALEAVRVALSDSLDALAGVAGDG